MPQAAVDSKAISVRTVRCCLHCGGYDSCRIHARRLLAWLLTLLVCAPISAQASFFHGETLDTVADVITWVVMVVVPLTVIALFWMVHVLPEKIAEKRHHPQKAAIQTLCLLSLVFGGLLWPLAWLWAYVKPVGYKIAYGTDKHDDYFKEAGEHAETGLIEPDELQAVRQELEGLAARGLLTPELRVVLNRLISLQQQPVQPGPSGETR